MQVSKNNEYRKEGERTEPAKERIVEQRRRGGRGEKRKNVEVRKATGERAAIIIIIIIIPITNKASWAQSAADDYS